MQLLLPDPSSSRSNSLDELERNDATISAQAPESLV
jgi:hypothetical protein